MIILLPFRIVRCFREKNCPKLYAALQYQCNINVTFPIIILAIFFWQKQNDIHSFKSIEYIRYNNIINIAKNVKDGTANILTSSKLIAYNDKMPTNNMIKSKSLEYPCFWICNVDVQIIDWICNWLTEVDLSIGTNEHRNKTRNQTTPHKTTNTTSHSDDEITKKGKNHLCENHLFDWKKRKKDAEGWF